jgi:prepilin-type N-terminal cleavage/methylation domain-containing protein
MRRPMTRGQRGFTLVEMIMTIVLLGIMAGLGSSMIADVFRTSLLVNSGDASTAEARYALERIARELRETKYITTGYVISSPSPLASASSITFTRAINGVDTVITIAQNSSNVDITYATANGSSTSTLVSGVSGFTVAFLGMTVDATTNALTVGTTTSTLAVKEVVITLAITDPASGRAISQQTRVGLRNA